MTKLNALVLLLASTAAVVALPATESAAEGVVSNGPSPSVARQLGNGIASLLGLPVCAVTCVNKLTKGSAIGNCPSTDPHCICSSSAFLDDISCCLAATCSPTDQASATKVAQSFCSIAGGVSNMPTSVTCKHKDSIPRDVELTPLDGPAPNAPSKVARNSLAFPILGLPACANSCVAQLTHGSMLSDCPLSDVHCICSSQKFLNDIGCCLQSSCNKFDQDAASRTAKFFCSIFGGVNNLPSSPTCHKSAAPALEARREPVVIKKHPNCNVEGLPLGINPNFVFHIPDIISGVDYFDNAVACQELCYTEPKCQSYSYEPNSPLLNLKPNCALFESLIETPVGGIPKVLPFPSGIFFSDRYPGDGTNFCYSGGK